MARDFLHDILTAHVEAGSDPEYWWDEERIPLDSIDKRVTDLLDLRGKKAVVTGGGGMNLGQACVNRLAGLGADVAVVDLEPSYAQSAGRMRWQVPPDADGVAERAAEKWKTKAVAVYGDVANWESAREVMAECHRQLGGIDILVNNATHSAVGEFAGLTEQQVDASIRGAIAGPLYTSHIALEYMIPQGSGRIINIGSEAAESAFPGLTLYGSLKAGLNAFTRFLGKEVAKYGVHVLGVNPGSMWGPDRPLPKDAAATLYARGRIAIQRFELPEEVANMVAFLASDAASAMAGTVVNMGGGQSI